MPPLVPARPAEQRIELPCAGQPVATAPRHHTSGARRDQGASRARPLARRAESTLRPPAVFIRARKPCVRLRLTTEGWKVRFMVDGPWLKKPYIRARYGSCCQPSWGWAAPPPAQSPVDNFWPADYTAAGSRNTKAKGRAPLPVARRHCRAAATRPTTSTNHPWRAGPAPRPARRHPFILGTAHTHAGFTAFLGALPRCV